LLYVCHCFNDVSANIVLGGVDQRRPLGLVAREGLYFFTTYGSTPPSQSRSLTKSQQNGGLGFEIKVLSEI